MSSFLGIGTGVTTSSEDFVGVSNSGIDKFLRDIVTPALSATVSAIKNHAKVFNTLNDGWEGIAKENFMANFSKGEMEAQKVIATSYQTLLKEIAQIADGMIQQDQNMVERQG